MAIEVTPIEGGVCAPLGFRAGSAYAGIRKVERDDIAVIMSDVPATAAGVFTTNVVQAWCVQCNRTRVKSEKVRGIVCNAGNANACNGMAGLHADMAMTEACSDSLAALSAQEYGTFLTASTGVIGRPFPIEGAKKGIAVAFRALRQSPEGSAAAARAIMTTDTFSKEFSVEVKSPHGTYRIGGIAKGSGMIAPNMATMLAFFTTDAKLEREALQDHLSVANQLSFNRTTVDGDTSTNDMVLLLANGESGVTVPKGDHLFAEALLVVCTELAKMIARDGEGATKLVTITVKGSLRPAEAIARSIAESPLVKTAIFGNDPNWGRIMMAAGKAGVPFDPSRASIMFAGRLVLESGVPTDVDLDLVSESMKAKEVEIVLDLGNPELVGNSATVWTCDFSYDYVKINAEYTT